MSADTSERLLVTGGTGFLGTPLVKRLAEEGYAITAMGTPSRPENLAAGVEYLSGDLADSGSASALLNPWRWDALINLAAPIPADYTENERKQCELLSLHVCIAYNLCAAAPVNWTGRIIHASSMTVYGAPLSLPVTEQHPRRPSHAYGLAKLLGEEIMLAAPKCADVWVLRFPGLFSESRKTGALSNFMRAAAEGRDMEISASPAPWDILHVDDAVDAIVRALNATGKSPGAINVSYGEPVELSAIAEWIAQKSGSGVKVRNDSGTRHPVMQLDNTRSKTLLGVPTATLHERLGDLWAVFSAGSSSK
jgi:nucleoside-diphosphate-sugar epimerase